MPWARSCRRDRPWVVELGLSSIGTWRTAGARNRSPQAPKRAARVTWLLGREFHSDLVSVVLNTTDGATEVREQHREQGRAPRSGGRNYLATLHRNVPNVSSPEDEHHALRHPGPPQAEHISTPSPGGSIGPEAATDPTKPMSTSTKGLPRDGRNCSPNQDLFGHRVRPNEGRLTTGARDHSLFARP